MTFCHAQKIFLSPLVSPKLEFATAFAIVSSAVKPKLLVVELWGLGDLAIATPFLREVAERFEVTLLAKPHALELQPRFWPGVRVISFVAPWTVFLGKYRFWYWPWKEMFNLRQKLRSENFEFGLSARPDPRDHLLLKFLCVKNRFGFPGLGSSIFLTDLLNAPGPTAHRYEFWRVAGKFIGLELPPRQQITLPTHPSRKLVLVHSGARLSARVWPLEYYRALVRLLRQDGHAVQVVCDPEQKSQWQKFGESNVVNPRTITELLSLLDQAAVFIGNCSGPGHLAAVNGVPTFTFFGPSLPEWFVPLHPQAEWLEDKTCPYKPCKDYCRFPTPHCLENITVENVWPRIKSFVQTHLRASA
jgi:heptosyltransferase-2